MAKLLLALLFVAVSSVYANADKQCSTGTLQAELNTPLFKNSVENMADSCTAAMMDQVQMEIKASHTYLAMAAHFLRDTVNRPGFAEFFLKAAKEEREHGAKLIEYMLMRGQLRGSLSDLIKRPVISASTWKNGEDALEKALALESEVTQSIRSLTKTCDTATVRATDNNANGEFHASDWLTSVYLEEQLHGQRDIAGKLVTLKKLMKAHTDSALGEFLFDKNLA